MNPLTSLKRLVSSSTPVLSGSVTRVTSSTITVRSKSGLKSFSLSDTSKYKPGDGVRFQGNTLLGKTVSADILPVFKV